MRTTGVPLLEGSTKLADSSMVQLSGSKSPLTKPLVKQGKSPKGLLNPLPIPIWIRRTDRNVHAVIPAVRRLYGYSIERKGVPCWSIWDYFSVILMSQYPRGKLS